jgi:ATP-dependent Lon protease
MTKIRRIPLLPLRGILIFPYMVMHFDVGREKSIKALEKAMSQDQLILLSVQKDANIDLPEPEDIYRTGTVSKIRQLLKLPGDTIRVLVEGSNRALITKYIKTEPYFEVEINEIHEEEQEKTVEIEALMRGVEERFEDYVKLSKKVSPEILITIDSIEEPGRFADLIASNLNLKIKTKQEILEAITLRERLNKLYMILNKEIEILELEKRINTQVRKQMEKTQKEYYLKEKMKAIQKELDEHDEHTNEIQEYHEKIKQKNLPEDVKEKISKELDRLEKMPPAAAEAVVIRNYIDWILDLPWAEETKDQLDLEKAEKVLEEDHYGLKKVKERILEFLAVRQMTDRMKGPILCLVGPPGVGKTSLAKSVARALNRKFVKLSLGGVRDEAEIRGHRRTYVGALPGRIIQGMKQAGSKNPVFLLDEIDKLSSDFRGDPASALLEVLDPEQNNAFSDHFIEAPFDLSKVLFITTANATYRIPRPLLDRMETIYISGYTEEEKVKIAERHLIPKQLKEHGLSEEKVNISQGAVKHIIRYYTREAGVRNLERNIAGLCRKSARILLKEKDRDRIKITTRNLRKFLGVPKYRYGEAEKKDEIGVSTGLAWTESGGDILAVEVAIMKGKGKFILTGMLGEVMQESARAGLSYIRSKSDELKISEDFYSEKDIHIHVPEGAIPKDGPSAGITITTAIVSALIQKPVSKDFAMTGEITLRGRVLPVGGIKEKVLAAHRAGIRNIILPKENKKDLEEIPNNIKKKLNFFLVDHMDQVLEKTIVKDDRNEN